jgi:hypothetical protein
MPTMGMLGDDDRDLSLVGSGQAGSVVRWR